MKRFFTHFSIISLLFFSLNSIAQVGINTINPTSTLHVYGNTVLPTAGATINLLNQNFNSAYTVVHANNGMTGCSSPATNGWIRTTVGNSDTNCSSCSGGWLWINSDQSGCFQNATARIDLTTAPTTTSITISFDYRFNYYSGDSFRVYLFNNTTTTQVGANLIGLLSSDANTNYNATVTVVAGNSYSLRFEYIGNFDYGAAVDNILVTETSSPTAGSYTFRLEDGTQGSGKVMTSDASGNAYWQSLSGGGTDSQTLSIAGNLLSISNGNSVTLPSGGSGTYSFTNGLTDTSGTVRLGGTLSQNTTLNLDTRDLTFSSSTSSAFPGEMILQGSDRTIMETRFDENYVSFGGGFVLVDGDDGVTFTDSGGDTFTRDFTLGYYNGESGGSAFAMGSIEYVVDGLDELLFECSSLNPLVNNDTRLGSSNKRWTAVYATNGTIQTSDINLKTDIKDLSYGLNEILKLKPISYKWKNDGVNRNISNHEKQSYLGFSAQQLLTILPEVVETHSWNPVDEKGNFKREENSTLGVRYSEIIPVVVNAIQEQQQQIEELKKQVAEMKVLISTLKKG